MRVVRSCHPEVTIILPGEKVQVHPGDDVRGLIAPYVAVIRQALDNGVGEWKGFTAECRVGQVRRLLEHHFHFHEGSVTEDALGWLIEDLLYVHKTHLADKKKFLVSLVFLFVCLPPCPSVGKGAFFSVPLSLCLCPAGCSSSGVPRV